MKWLEPDEENLLRRVKKKYPFFKEDSDAIRRLTARGIFTSQEILCPRCGQHPSFVVSFTERGKIACLILDVLAQKPVT
jgi:hypothetical protein